MKAIAIHEFGPAGNLTEIDIPVPIPGEHEILIEMYATSVNPADLKIREGSLPAGSGHTAAFPLIPGIDVAGVVVSTGSGVSRFKPGDAVFGLMQVKKGGAYAEYTLANGQELAPIPPGLSFEAAGVLPAAGLAAWQALASARVSSRDRVLVHDGAGGIGSLAIQLAKLRGATVITTVSGDELDLAWGIGADQAIDWQEQDFAAILGQSIDVVIDTAGGLILNRSFAVLAPGGRLISTEERPDPVQAAAGDITAAYLTPAADPFQLAELARLTAERRLKLLIGQSFPLTAEGLRSAHLLSECRQTQGKVAITIK
ncbi:hypothetical protein QW71_26810 [Paenibacillus sp. IHB B 3415]|uniref:NADP-dependent oxidoreductase n=1 Tax=Paenibacillus sp. IHB B 3415 TaxID=867080 RepID=UPI000574D830|nr:NADP-dependent oxidoreductase [Paenibacillus sp. IHB B 3415]KHL92856.1 hypothetical protein QW71_26810 [Paenibacillus sp. IHB B 3415]